MNFLTIFSAIAWQISVPHTYWVPPSDTSFVVDSDDTFTDPFINADHVVPIADRAAVIDRACVIWGRTADVAKQCRSSSTGIVTDEADGFDQNDVDEFQFHSGASATVGGEAWCHFWLTADADECDFWLSQQTGLWSYFDDNGANTQCEVPPCSSGLTRSGSTRCDAQGNNCITLRQGAPSNPDYFATTIHEVGHTLGLFHPTCDGSSYDCPIMSGFADRVTTWPQWDEVQSLRGRWGTGARRVQFSLWDVAASGAMTQSVTWVSFPSSMTTETPPRIACRPDAGSSSSSCVMTTNTIGTPTLRQGPKFYFLTPSTSAVTASAPVIASAFSEGPVDVAFGDSGRYLALGKKPTDQSHPTGVVVYAGAIGSAPTAVNLATHSSPQFTHTEPRVTYHETQGVFVGVWPTKFGKARIVTFNLTGGVIDIASVDSFTNVPIEISCDNHLAGSQSECNLFVQPNSTEVEALDGRYLVYRIPIGFAGDLVTAADGNIVLPAAPQYSARGVALLVDTATYGNGQVAGQVSGNAWFITEDRFRSAGSNTVAYALDNDPFFVTVRHGNSISMNSGTNVGQTNVTSWDWNESVARFVSIRSGPFN